MGLSRRQRLRLVRGSVYAATVAALVLIALAVDWGALGGALFKWKIVKDQFPDILTNALRNTVIFTIFGFIGGLSLGLLLAIMRLSSVKPYRGSPRRTSKSSAAFPSSSPFSFSDSVFPSPPAGNGQTRISKARCPLRWSPVPTSPKRYAPASKPCPAVKWKPLVHSACRTRVRWPPSSSRRPSASSFRH